MPADPRKDHQIQSHWNTVVLLLSIIGSISSILALAIVLIEEVASETGPQLAVWRVLFIVLALFFTAATLLAMYFWTSTQIKSHVGPFYILLLKIAMPVVVGTLLVGVFIDGLFAALYWKPWMGDFSTLARSVWRSL